jgi:hypothetical protein
MRLGKRLTKVEMALARDREENRPRVVVYLPRKDGDTRPVGVVGRSGGALMVLYDRDHPDPTVPDGE